MPDEVSDAPVADAPETAPESAPEAAPAAVESTNPTPWGSDLDSRFNDPAIRSEVDAFLRETVQPYVTRLEQTTAENSNAERLWNDLSEAPVETFLAIADQMFGEGSAERVQQILSNEEETPPVPTEPDISGSEPVFNLDELPPEVREAVEFTKQQQRETEWNRAITKLQEDNPDVKINEGLFAPFVTAAEGDLDSALDSYKTFLVNAAAEAGVEPAQEEAAPEAPPTIGSENTSPSEPPVSEQPETLDDAIDSLWEDLHPAPPTL